MASVLTFLPDELLPKKLAPGQLLPLTHFPQETSRFSHHLLEGGSLYLVARGPKRALRLVAVLEAPERGGVLVRDKRAPGWYAAANVVPVTDLTSLQSKLGLTPSRPWKALGKDVEVAIRALIDDEDVPVVTAAASPAPGRAGPKLSGPPLERAVTLLNGGHVLDAIGALVEAWRETHEPALADLLDRATRLLPSWDRPLLSTRAIRGSSWSENCTNATGHAEWMAAAKQPAANLPQLVDNLFLDGNGLVARIDVLRALGPDPRIATGTLLRAFAQSKSYIELVPLIGIGDARCTPTLLATQEDLEMFGRPPPAWKAMFAAAKPARSSKPRAELAAVARAIEAREEPILTEQRLVDALADGEDHTFGVYADWLQAKGHPRGEYIALCLQEKQRGLSPALARRRAALLEIPYLFGAVDDLAVSVWRERDRGVDRALTVSPKASDLVWRRAALQPLARAIATIEIVGDPQPSRVPGIVAYVDTNPNLRELTRMPEAYGRALADALGGRFAWKRGKLERAR